MLRLEALIHGQAFSAWYLQLAGVDQLFSWECPVRYIQAFSFRGLVRAPERATFLPGSHASRWTPVQEAHRSGVPTSGRFNVILAIPHGLSPLAVPPPHPENILPFSPTVWRLAQMRILGSFLFCRPSRNSPPAPVLPELPGFQLPELRVLCVSEAPSQLSWLPAWHLALWACRVRHHPAHTLACQLPECAFLCLSSFVLLLEVSSR